MVQLTAKGSTRYVQANLPVSVAEAESIVVLSAVREAVEGLFAILESGALEGPKAALSQVVVLRGVLEKCRDESTSLLEIVELAEQRIVQSI